ncbi:hypothetical protein [Huintestinicola sp.]
MGIIFFCIRHIPEKASEKTGCHICENVVNSHTAIFCRKKPV